MSHQAHGWGIASAGLGVVTSVGSLWLVNHPVLQDWLFFGGIALAMVGIVIIASPAISRAFGAKTQEREASSVHTSGGASPIAVAQHGSSVHQTNVGTQTNIEQAIFGQSSAIPAEQGIPDMPIRDVFFHIQPDLLDVGGSPWEQIGEDIIDKISTGQLFVWGREFDPNNRSPHRPLAIIPAERWSGGADFTYWFLEENHQNVMHVECHRLAGSAGPWKYSDLRFNERQVTRIWPRPRIWTIR